VIELCLLAFGAALLFGSTAAFFLYVPFLPIAAVGAILLGMALTFLIGVWVGGTPILRRLRAEHGLRRSRLRPGPENLHIVTSRAPSADTGLLPSVSPVVTSRRRWLHVFSE
jgi:hypothetical protein